jgi:4-oxalocrotonate tautomerase
MPTIIFYGPKLERDKKIDLIRNFTKSAAAATGIDETAFVVYLQEFESDRVGVGGELLEDRLKRAK